MVPGVPARFFHAPKEMAVFDVSNASWNIIYRCKYVLNIKKKRYTLWLGKNSY